MTDQSTTTASSDARHRVFALAPSDKHIVDQLIEERAPTLSRHWSWAVLRPALYSVLNYARARRMADAIAPLPGRQALDFVSEVLNLTIDVTGLERIPRNGRLVVIANHPTGIGDGVAVYDAIKRVRPDICFMANADAHRVCPGFHDVLIAVEWVLAKRSPAKTRETLRAALQAFEDERPLMIFPAGRLARKVNGVLTDPEWEKTAVSLARKHAAPIAPVCVDGPESHLFHFFNSFSAELRDITLFHELLNKTGSRFTLRVGPLIDPDRLEGDPGALTDRLKAYIQTELRQDANRPFAV